MDPYKRFKPIRNRIRKYQPRSIIDRCVGLLHDANLFASGRVRSYQPWTLLLMIKWSFLYGEPDDRSKLPVTDNDFNRMINDANDLFGAVRMPHQYDTFDLFFKNIAHQQFLFQRAPNTALIGRQKLLFTSPETPEMISRAFETVHSLSLDEYLEFAFMVLARFISERGPMFPRQFFSTVEQRCRAGAVDTFLSLISADYVTIKQRLIEEDKRFSNFEFTLYEQTPLKKYPLLRIGDRFLCYSPHVLYLNFETFVYDSLKAWNAEQFSEAFGPVLEKYVERGLKRTQSRYYAERDLKQLLGAGRVTDFLLPDADGNVLVEVKAVEMSELGRVSPDARVVANSLKTSVIKGIEQVLSTAKRLEELPNGNRISSPAPWFALVVTYKDLYLHTAEQLLVGTARAEMERFMRDKSVPSDSLPFSHIYIISIDEFDRMTHLLETHQARLPDIMRRAVADDGQPREARFAFWQHLYKHGDARPPREIEAGFDEIAERAKQKLREHAD